MHKIVLLGGGGFIGNALARVLVERGHDVLVLNRRGYSDVAGVRALSIERGQPARVVGAATGFGADTLIDMIAFEQPDTQALLDALKGMIRRYILISSGDVYAAFGRLLGTETGAVDNAPLDENAPLRVNLYPFRGLMEDRYWYDKIPLEKMALHVGGMEAVIVRLPMVFGPKDPRRRFQSFAKALLSGKTEITMTEKRAQWVSPFLYVDDAACAIALAACHKDATGQVFNIGPDIHHNEAERARAFVRATGNTIHIKTTSGGQEKDGENYDQHIILNSDHLRRMTGWAPKVADQAAYQSVWDWERQRVKT